MCCALDEHFHVSTAAAAAAAASAVGRAGASRERGFLSSSSRAVFLKVVPSDISRDGVLFITQTHGGGGEEKKNVVEVFIHNVYT